MTTTTDAGRTGELINAYLQGHDTRLLDDDATFVDVASGTQWTGPEAIAGMLAWFYEVAFDAHLEDARVVVGDGAAVLEGTFVGTHQAEFAGVPATGREVRVPLVVLYDVADGRIAGARLHFAVASFLAQVAA